MMCSAAFATFPRLRKNHRPHKLSGYNFIDPFLGERRKAMKKILLALAILLVSFVIFTSYPASAQEAVTGDNASVLATGSGLLQTAIFLSETAVVGNESIVIWKNAFNRNVTLRGVVSQCIEMRYSGEVKVSSPDLPPYQMQFRALVDGVVAQGGAPFFDAIDPGIYTTAAMNWWVCGLKAGAHNVKIQFGPYFEFSTSYVRNRTLIIEYAQ